MFGDAAVSGTGLPRTHLRTCRSTGPSSVACTGSPISCFSEGSASLVAEGKSRIPFVSSSRAWLGSGIGLPRNRAWEFRARDPATGSGHMRAPVVVSEHALAQGRRRSSPHILEEKQRLKSVIVGGGPSRNRTGVQGFAVLCVTTPPSGRRSGAFRQLEVHGQVGSSRLVGRGFSPVVRTTAVGACQKLAI
jgi:hypothetical protein